MKGRKHKEVKHLGTFDTHTHLNVEELVIGEAEELQLAAEMGVR